MRNISHVCILYMTLDIITMLSFRDSPFNNCLQATATHLIVHGALKLLGAETITIFGHNIYSYRIFRCQEIGKPIPGLTLGDIEDVT